MAIENENILAINNLASYYQFVQKNYKEMVLELYIFNEIKCI